MKPLRKKIFTATEARKYWFQILELAGKPGKTITITLQGHPPIAILSQEELEGWIETVEIMSDPQLMKDIREAEADMAAGRFVTLEKLEKDLFNKHVPPHPRKRRQKKSGKAA